MTAPHSSITDRQHVRVNEWWTSQELADARGEYHGFLMDHIQRLAPQWTPPEMGGMEHRTLMLAGLLPVYNEQFNAIRMEYPKSNPDCSSLPDYDDSARREKLSIPDWFALMLRSWTFESARTISTGYGMRINFCEHRTVRDENTLRAMDEVHEKGVIDNLRSFGFGRPNGAVPFLKARKHEGMCWKLAFLSWPQQPSLLNARKEFIAGLTMVIEKALHAIPVEEEALVRNDMRKVMSLNEPIWRDRNFNLFYPQPTQLHENLMRIQKSWWAEIHDMYVFGTRPPTDFTMSAYAANLVHCGIRTLYPDVQDINSLHIQMWRRHLAKNERILLVQRNGFGRTPPSDTSIFAPSIACSLHDQRTTNAGGTICEKRTFTVSGEFPGQEPTEMEHKYW